MNLSAYLKFAACFAFASLSCSAATLYDLSGTVLDGNTGENTYISATGTGSGLVYTPATPSLALTLPGSGGYAQVIGNFASTALTNIGDTITLSYSFTVSSATVFGTGDQGFRLGLFNSAGSSITGNTAGTDANANTDTGYAAMYRGDNGTSGATNTFYQRNSSNPVLFSTSTFNSTVLDGSAPTLTKLGIATGNLSVTGSFSITLISGGVRLTSIINGGTAQTRDDTTSVVTTFDEFGIFGLSGAATPVITFTDLTVTSSAVPEPSTYALLAGAVVLTIVSGSRRVRRCAAAA